MNFDYSKVTTARVLASVGVVSGIVLAMFIRSYFINGSQHTAPAVAEVVERHLESANRQAALGLDSQFDPIHEFFAQAKLGTQPFAEDALGWDSKWQFVKGYFLGDDAHREYLEGRFAARVFAPEDLEALVQQVVGTYLHHLDSVDSTFLVELKADLEGIPASGFSAGIDRTVIEQSLAAAIRDAVQAAQAEIPGAVGRELASYVGGEVLTQAAFQLATSAGILSVGAASGTVTFGVGIIVGIVVDMIIGWAYDEMFDPAGELAGQLDETLANLEFLIVSGDGEEGPGLYQRLHDYAECRAEARRAAISAVGLPQGKPGADPTL